MVKLKHFFAPLAAIVLSLIISFGWSGILEWNNASNFVAALLFWIICIICIVISLFSLKVLKLDFPYKVTIVMTNVLYYIIFVGIVSFGVFSISRMSFIFLNLILLFLYLIITVPVFLISVKEEGDN